MSDLNDFQSGIKSVQRGSQAMDSLSEAVTIDAVVMAQSMVVVNVESGNAASGCNFATGTLTNPTTLTIDIGTRVAQTFVKWQVVEFQPLYFGARIKSFQRGETAMPDDAVSTTAVIDAVVTEKTLLNISKRQLNATGLSKNPSAELTNATTLTFHAVEFFAGFYFTIAWEVIEFY